MKTVGNMALLAALITVCGGGSALGECKVAKLADLPVTMEGLRPTIHARIDGHDVRLLVDSGAFYSMISPGTAAELKLGLQPTRFGFFIRGVGGDTGAQVTTIKNFTLDTIPLRNLLFLVGGSELGPDVAGLLGRNVLDLADTEYDLANGAIRLMRPNGCNDRGLGYWAGDKPVSLMRLLSVEDRLTPLIVEVLVNGVKLKALLDTGAAGSTIHIDAAKRAGMPISGGGTTDAGFSGGVGRRMVRSFIAPMTSITIGDEQIKTSRIRVLDAPTEGWDMLLGADFFLSHRVFVARSQRTVYFTYNGGPVFNLVAKPIGLPEPSGIAPTAAATEVPNLDPAEPDAATPTDAAAFSRRGEASASRRDYPAALADLDRAVALAPDNAEYVYQRATVRLAVGQVFLAMSDIEQSLKLRPGDPDALMIRAELRITGRDRVNAIADLNTIAQTIAPAADLRLRLGKLYERLDKLDAAIAQYNLWIAAHPDDRRRPQALNGRCWSRALLGQDLDKALADCEGAHRSMPKIGNFLDSRGLVHLRLGQFDKAIADYDAAIAIQPKSAWTLYGRGLAKLKTGDAAGGKADMDAAVALDATIAEKAALRGIKP